MKILVTGGSGFLGKVIIRQLLDKGHSVCALSRRPLNDLQAWGVQLIEGDLLDKGAALKAAKGTEAIFHVAAKAGIWGSYRAYFETNVLGTRNVLEAAKQNEVPYVVHTSTASVVFNQKPLLMADESAPYAKKWLCPYAQTKALAEKEVLAANGQGHLQTIALRPHLIWGPGDPHLFPRLIERAQKNQLFQVGSGTNWVDLTHVENVAHAHVMSLEALMKGIGQGKAYFVTQGEPIPLWPWINGFLKTLGLSPVRKKIPLMLSYGLSAWLENLHRILPILGEPQLTRFVALELAQDHTFSSAAAEKDLGYHPILSFAEGMEERIRYWRDYLAAR